MSARAWLALALLVCTASGVHARPDDPPLSIYQLDAALTDQDGRSLGLDAHRGHPVLVTMFYSGCQATCPLIIETLRAIERQVPPGQRANLRVLLVSLDPEHDTPAALAELARTRRVDTKRWTLARADEPTVRRVAALLDLQYRKLPDGGFNHSTVIALLSPRGEIEARSAALGSPDERLLAPLRAAMPKPSAQQSTP
jgi:protein SCO1